MRWSEPPVTLERDYSYLEVPQNAGYEAWGSDRSAKAPA